MKTVSIVYFTASGYTGLLAESIAAGLRSEAELAVELLPIAGDKIEKGRFKDEALFEKLKASDGIIFGSPTFMGGVAAQFKAFADASADAWFKRLWSGKLAGAFTTSGSPSGDKQGTLIYLNTLAQQHGMVWVGQNELPSAYSGSDKGINRLGSHLGVMGLNSNAYGAKPVLDSGDALTGELFGKRFASFVKRLG
jgi:NAD(P)H dehydrogenase (quinone)